MSGAFSTQILSEKLTKLTASQQCIENLSHWCIFHRSKAKHIVKTWEKEFFSAPKEKRVSFLYLANDIIQNSRRKGSEFVNEFWKVLNSSLKDVKANGGDNGKKAVSRLITIWEERKVFGSRGQSLRDELLGDGPLPDLEKHDENKAKPSSSFKKAKSDAGIVEKISRAYNQMYDDASKEEATVDECSSAARRIEDLKEKASTDVGVGLADELQEQQKILQLTSDELQTIANARTKLVTCLKEVLSEQEEKLERVQNQIQAARIQAEQVQLLMHQLLQDTDKTQNTITPADDGAEELKAETAPSNSPEAMLSSVFSSFAAEELSIHQDKRQRFEVPLSITENFPPLQLHQAQLQPAFNQQNWSS